MADAEMVFPDKKIFLKPLLIIQLLIAIIGGIIATFAALLSASPLQALICPTQLQYVSSALLCPRLYQAVLHQ